MLHEAEALVFSGGGVRAIAFCGALSALEAASRRVGCEPYARLRRVAGTSAGAIVALHVAAGADAAALDAALSEGQGLALLRPFDAASVLRLVSECGLDDGDALRSLADRALVRNGMHRTTTFAELETATGRCLTVTATRLPEGVPVRFGTETTPDASVSEAVAASMSVPVLFAPRTVGGALCCDGGLVDNMPFAYEARRVPAGRAMGMRLVRGPSVPPACCTTGAPTTPSVAPVSKPPPSRTASQLAIELAHLARQATAAKTSLGLGVMSATRATGSGSGHGADGSDATESVHGGAEAPLPRARDVDPMEYFSSVVSAPIARVEKLEMGGLSPEARASIVTIDTGTAAPMDFSPSPDMQAWLRDRGCAAGSAYASHATAMRECWRKGPRAPSVYGVTAKESSE